MYPRSAVIEAHKQLKARCKVISIEGWDGEITEYNYHAYGMEYMFLCYALDEGCMANSQLDT